MSQIKIFQIDEEWYAGESLESCLKFFKSLDAESAKETLEYSEFCEIEENEYNTLKHCGDEGGGPIMTFRERLDLDVKEGQGFPCLFAAVNY